MVGELFITSGDATVAFDPGEEVFDRVALPVESAAELAGPAPARPGWDAGPHTLIVQPLAKVVCVESAVGEQPAVAQARQERGAGEQVVLRAGPHRQLHGPAQRVDCGGHLAVEAALDPTHRLARLAASRISAVSVDLDVRAVQAADLALSQKLRCAAQAFS